ncbi:hypothetical protein R3P38DRAFT_2640298 [Favolaschia claudopus]|uniref:DUF6589 domain-containing protein n=1 Tax=Favolaschia claudopus TaxID=2862362 RepID=A0AAW0AJE8_9AGAR
MSSNSSSSLPAVNLPVPGSQYNVTAQQEPSTGGAIQSLPAPTSRISTANTYDGFFSAFSQPNHRVPNSRRSESDIRSTVSSFQAQFQSTPFNPDAFPSSGYDTFFSKASIRPAIPSRPVISARPATTRQVPSPNSVVDPIPTSSPLLRSAPISRSHAPQNPPSPDTSIDTLVDFSEPEPVPETVEKPAASDIPSLPKGSEDEKIGVILQMLRKARISPTTLFLAALTKSTYADKFYTSETRPTQLLETLYDDPRGKLILDEWFWPHSLDLVCDRLTSEANSMVKSLSTHKSVSDMTPEFLRSWSLKDTVAKKADEEAPTLLRVLRCTLNDQKSLEKNKKKSNETACYTLLGQLVSRRSQQALDFAGPLSLMWWASGCSREAVEILQQVGLSKCFDTTKKLLKSTANYCLSNAKNLVRRSDGYLFNYDNINFSTSEYVEQRAMAPAKVQSGTHFIVLELLNPNPAAYDLPFLLSRAQNAPDLDFNRDLVPTVEQSLAVHHRLCSYVIRVFFRYHKSMQKRTLDPELQSPPRRPLPPSHTTKQFPLKICTIEEASVKGNLACFVESHITQLGLTYDELTKPILSINDQATQALNRSAKSICAFDKNPFLRCQIWQLGIGLFHLCLNLIWAILHVHRGHVNHHGTLSHLFVIMEKARLGGHHPDYHSLLAALMQILDGLLLDAWRIECGHATLDGYAASNPSVADLRNKAAKILYNHATPTRTPLLSSHPLDTVRENTRRLIHDLIYVSEVTRAVSEGDFGRVEDILPTLGMMFRGAGSKNYSTEILHFIHNMKHVWNGNGFDEVVRDNMIVRMKGNHCEGVDANMEHNIGRIKELFATKGMYGSWDRLADISAAIDVIDSVKKNAAMSLGASYQGSSHKTVDTSHLVWRVAHKARELSLNTFLATRDNNSKPSVDILSAGEAVLKSASLATFNKNRRALLKGIMMEEEKDDLPAMNLSREAPIEFGADLEQ